MILSDRTIRAELEAGRIVIEPLTEGAIQPSSVDLTVDRYFRVFRNHSSRVIDVKEDQSDLTELVEVSEGDAFILHPGEFALGSTAERVALPDDLVARLEGKALALDTTVPTEAGWRRMGDLEVGDHVFDERGQVTTVVAATEPLHGRPCFSVEFSDGQSIVADATHQWVTCDKWGRRRGGWRPQVVTTEDIARSVMVGEEWNHQVALAGPVRYPSVVLPVDPYGQALMDRHGNVDVLPRTLTRQQQNVTGPHRFRAIVGVRPSESVSVRCIQVANPTGQFLVGRTFVPTHNSSLGRLGLLIHSTAGFVDAGWNGHLTLELSNVANLPITIYPSMRIGQISFLQMTTAADQPYGTGTLGSKYRGQLGPTPSRYFENFRPRG